MSDNMSAPILPSLPASQNTRQMMWQQAPIQQKHVETRSIIYQSDTMNQLMKMVERVAPSQANVLILGESGTGK